MYFIPSMVLKENGFLSPNTEKPPRLFTSAQEEMLLADTLLEECGIGFFNKETTTNTSEVLQTRILSPMERREALGLGELMRQAKVRQAIKLVEALTGERAFGFFQTAAGAGQMVAATAFGATGIGAVGGTAIATMGADNVMTGLQRIRTGASRATVLNRLACALGKNTRLYGPEGALNIETALNLVSAVPPVVYTAAALRLRSITSNLQSPITFQFDPNKFYSGIPIDIIKPRSLWKSNKLKSDGMDPGIFTRTHKFKFEPAIYHKRQDSGLKNKGPENGQNALYNSVQINENSTRRIGFDTISHEIVLFDQTFPGKDVFHGHVRSWEELHSKHKAALMRCFGFNSKGKLKK